MHKSGLLVVHFLEFSVNHAFLGTAGGAGLAALGRSGLGLVHGFAQLHGRLSQGLGLGRDSLGVLAFDHRLQIGQSLLDRGQQALGPLIEAIVATRSEHKLILGVGAGARLRHTYHICLDLGIPTGGLAMVAGAVDEQNTRMLQSLLAKHKGIALNKDHFLDLPLWLESGMIPIMTGMPPYHYWEPPNGNRRVPANGRIVTLSPSTRTMISGELPTNVHRPPDFR